MSTLAERTFTINTQAVGSIEVTATLETANASLASYITESRTYLDDVRARIDSDLSALTAEAATERSSAYNKNFGILSGTVAEGNHLHDDRYYTKGSVDNLLDNYQFKIAPESGFNLPIGTTANTLAAGNDPRFSDAREPVEHMHTKSAITDFNDADYATAEQGGTADRAMQIEDTDERYYTQYQVESLLRQKEETFEKKTAFNKDFGVEQHTVAEGDHTHHHFSHEVRGFTTRRDSFWNTLTTKNYVDEEIRSLLTGGGFYFIHNQMAELDGDDHLQYHTDERGDIRYPRIADLTEEARLRNEEDGLLNDAIDLVQTNVNTEIDARTAADVVLHGDITTVQTNLNTESSTRLANDGTLQDNIETVQSNLNTEKDDRIAADSTLQTNIHDVNNALTNEANTRKLDDETLQENIDSLENDLSTEVDDRKIADTTLQTNITEVSNNLASETTNRTNADTSLSNSIDQLGTNLTEEAQERAAADTTLSNSIANVDQELETETTNRTNADTTLQNAIDNTDTALATEVSNRSSADSTLQSNITTVATNLTTESNNRSNADTTLQGNIDDVVDAIATEITNRFNADTSLQGAIDDTVDALSTEVTNRESADSSLATDISTLSTDLATETSNRSSADTTLQGNIDDAIDALGTEVTNRQNADTAITNTITANETARTNQRTTDLASIAEDIDDVDDSAVHILGDQDIQGTKTFKDNVVVEGEAILHNATIKSQGELDVGDAIVTLNAGETGIPSVNAGLEIERGTSTNAQLLWDEANDAWAAGINGNLKFLATQEYAAQEAAKNDGGEPAFNKNTAFNKNFGTTSNTVTQGNDARLSDSRTPKSHTHAISNITDLQNQLNGKSGVNHSHTIADITSLQTALNDKEPAFNKGTAFNKAFGTGYSNVPRGNDSRFSDARTPLDHDHAIADVTNLQTTLNGKAASSHTHSIANITSLQTTLNAKEAAFSKNTAFNKNFGTTSGTVTQGNDSRLSDSRTPKSHTHAIADVSSLQTELNAKRDVSNSYFTVNMEVRNSNPYITIDSSDSGSGHLLIQNQNKNAMHLYANTTQAIWRKDNTAGKISARLDMVGSTSETGDYQGYMQAYTRIVGVEGFADHHLTTRGYVNTEVGKKANTSHTHAISEITSLQTTLNGKAASSHTHSIANISGLQTELNNKASSSHTHAQSQITGLTSDLANKEPAFTKKGAFNLDFGTSSTTVCRGNDSRLSDTRTPKSHTHSIADITNLQTTLNGKAASSHTHSIANITSLQTSLNAKANLSGATFTGSSSINQYRPSLQINDNTDGTTGTRYSMLQHRINGKLSFWHVGYESNMDMRKQTPANASGVQYISARLEFKDKGNDTDNYQGYIYSSTKIRGQDSTDSDSLTTRGYVDGEFNKKANSSHTHSIANVSDLQNQLNDKASLSATAVQVFKSNVSVQSAAPYFHIKSTDSGNAHLQFWSSNQMTSMLYSSAGSTVLTKYNAGNNSKVPAQIVMEDGNNETGGGLIYTNCDIRGHTTGTPVADASLTSKAYVLGLLNAKVNKSGNEDIGGTKRFTSDHIEVAGGSPYVDLVRSGNRSGYLQGNSDHVLLHSDHGSFNRFRMYGSYSTMDRPLRGVDEANGNSYVTRNGITALLNTKANSSHTHTISNISELQNELNAKENSFTKNSAFNKNFGTAGDEVAVGSHGHQVLYTDVRIYSSVSDRKLRISAGNNKDSSIHFETDQDVLRAKMFADDSANTFSIQKLNSSGSLESSLNFTSTQIVSTTPVYSIPPPTSTYHLANKQYVDDNSHVVQQASNYEMVMPSSPPSGAGKKLQVSIVSGNQVYMVWV